MNKSGNNLKAIIVGAVASHFGMLYIFPFSMALVFTGFLLAVLIWQRQKKQAMA